MKKINLLIVVLGVVFMHQSALLKAQQDPMYTMYMWNTQIFNPAYSGSREVFSTMVLAREQWTGLDGAPSTKMLTLSSPLLVNSVALGLNVVNDQLGPANNTGIYGDFAYRLKTTDKAKLSFAVRAGADLYSADLAGLDNTDPLDPAFNQNVASSTLANFGAGVYYYSPRGYVGLSVPKLLNTEQNSGNNIVALRQELDETKRHYFFTAGYVFSLSADSTSVMFRPSLIVRGVEGGPANFDFSANFLIKQKLWIGAAYRYEESFAGILSFQFNPHLRAGYSYDFVTSGLSSYNNGTHEFMLGYDFFKPVVKNMSPRYF